MGAPDPTPDPTLELPALLARLWDAVDRAVAGGRIGTPRSARLLLAVTSEAGAAAARDGALAAIGRCFGGERRSLHPVGGASAAAVLALWSGGQIALLSVVVAPESRCDLLVLGSGGSLTWRHEP